MKYLALSILLLFVLGSCTSDEDSKPLETDVLQEPVVNTDPPMNNMTITMGTFSSYAHGLSGKAVIYTDANGMRTLRLEQFNMTAGPDVYVLLSKTNNYSTANTIPISMLKESYSNQNLSLTLDNNIDLSTYKFVLIYCVQFSSLFGFAEPKE